MCSIDEKTEYEEVSNQSPHLLKEVSLLRESDSSLGADYESFNI
jgi:hypothetical protein